MNVSIVKGDILKQDVDVIVNSWNRNIIPWWLLLPQGVSGAIKKYGGFEPFKELAKHGAIPLGEAVETNAGKLPYKAIIHVSGISMFWISSYRSVTESVRSAIYIAQTRKYNSIAFPLIGAGTGGLKQEKVLSWMKETLADLNYEGDVKIVLYEKSLLTPP